MTNKKIMCDCGQEATHIITIQNNQTGLCVLCWTKEGLKDWKEELGKVFYGDPGQRISYVQALLVDQDYLSRAEQKAIDMKIIGTHSEGEGQWCDTGEDMEWACRSECIDLAIARLNNNNL